MDKPLSETQCGMFVGYCFAPGEEWNGDYLVLDLEDVVDLDLAQDADGHGECYHPLTKRIVPPFYMASRFHKSRCTIVVAAP